MNRYPQPVSWGFLIEVKVLMLEEIIIVFTFLTRIPFKINFTYGEKEMGRTSRYFPLVGLTIGFLVALIIYLFSFINMQLAAIMGLIAGIILTGGLHLDGLMDTADGIFSARTKEEMLEIMKDSRVGAHGVTACIIFILFKFVLYTMIGQSHFNIFWGIIMAYIFSRWTMAYAILFFPGARSNGLANIFITYKRKWDFPIATVLTFLPIVIFKNWLIIIPLLVTFSFIQLYLKSIQKTLGGLTGDIYGSLAEISEVFFLLIFVLTEHWSVFLLA